MTRLQQYCNEHTGVANRSILLLVYTSWVDISQIFVAVVAQPYIISTKPRQSSSVHTPEMRSNVTATFTSFLLVLVSLFHISQWNGVVAETTNSTTTIEMTTTNPTFRQRLRRYFGYEHVLYHDGLFRWFVEHPPPPSTATTNTTNSNATQIPLLILLHFGRGNMRSSSIFGRIIEKDPWLRLAEQNGYLLLSPNAVVPRKIGKGYITHSIFFRDTNWNDLMGGRYNATVNVDDAGFLLKIVDWAIANRNVDPNRIYIAGHSSGGNMAQRMIIEYPNTFAAAASFVSTLPNRDIPFPSRGTPIAIFCGTNDNRVPYEGGYRDGRGSLMSAEDTRDYFVQMNHAGPMIEMTLPDIDPNDNCTITSQYFPHNITPVQYYKLNGGGHNFIGETTFAGFRIPSFATQLLENTLGTICNDADGATLAWKFMTQFTLASR